MTAAIIEKQQNGKKKLVTISNQDAEQLVESGKAKKLRNKLYERIDVAAVRKAAEDVEAFQNFQEKNDNFSTKDLVPDKNEQTYQTKVMEPETTKKRRGRKPKANPADSEE